MSFQAVVCNNKIHNHEYRPVAQSKRPQLLFEITDDGTYMAAPHEITWRGSKVAKFDGAIRVLKEHGGVLVAGDDKGSVKVIKERVMRRYRTGSAVVDIEFTDALRVAVVCEDSTLRIYEFQEESPVATVQFDEKLCGVAHMQNMLAVLTEHRMVLLDDVRLSETKAFHVTGDGLSFLSDRKIAVYHHNKIKLVDTETSGVVEKRVHRSDICRMVVRDGVMYTLSRDGHVKALDACLNTMDCFAACDISDLTVKDGRTYVLKNGVDVCVVVKMSESSDDEEIYRQLESKMNRYEYKGSLLLALERDNTKVLCCVLEYLYNAGGLKQALSNYTLDSLASILSVVNRSWHWTGHTKICVEVAQVILSDYVQFYAELRPYLDELAKNVADELLFQQECCIVASFAEEMLYDR